MKFFVLLAGYGEMPSWDELTPEERQEGMARHEAFATACAQRPGVEMLSGEALAGADAARTMRTRGGQTTITDGPFAEAAEQIGGYYVVEAPDSATVEDLCRGLPAYDIEIRPVLDM
ncbi:MAG: YciI family protein [Ornithinibacter sp.]